LEKRPVKKILAAAVAVSLLAAGVASAAPYRHHRAHRECTIRHHHRVCHWVR
jgi:hypothetical protein